MLTNKKGFTLIELLVVIAILATLAVTVFVALNPAKRLRDSRDARRKTDVATILDAIHTYSVDNGVMPPSVEALSSGTVYEVTNGAGTTPVPAGSICNGSNANNTGVTAGGVVDLSTDLANVLAELPYDPNADTTTVYTGYALEVSEDSSGNVTTVTVRSCGAENGAISASR